MKNKISLVLVLITILFSACTKMPTACMSADKQNTEVGTTVSFQSCATEADKITWDFGDGSKGEGENASHAYTKPGNYLVTMSAFSKKDKKWDKASSIVTVKDFVFKTLTLKSFPAKNNGLDWDGPKVTIPLVGIEIPGQSAPEPDINMVLSTASDSWSVDLATIADAKQEEYTFNLEAYNYKLTNEDFKLVLTDTGVELQGQTQVDPQPMQTFTFNPYTAISNGKINLSSNGYVIEITF